MASSQLKSKPLSKLCANRIHEWGPDGICTRPGCGKVKGLRGAKAHAPLVSSRTMARTVLPVQARAQAQSAVPPSVQSGSKLREAAQRLAARRGLHVVPADAEPEPDEPEPDEPEEPERPAAKEYSLTEWFGDEIPDAIVSGCAWTIRKGGHEPFEPDPVWKGRFDDAFTEGVGKALPRLAMPWWLALIIAAFCMYLSMRWGAPKIEKDKAEGDAKPDDAKETDTAPTDEKKDQGESWATKPTAPPSAATPKSVHDSASPVSLSSLRPSLDLPEGSTTDGPAPTAPRLSLVENQETDSAGVVTPNGQEESTL